MMTNSHQPLTYLAIAILCYILAGCATTKTSQVTYKMPSDYKHIAEYGWLPVVENTSSGNELYKSIILPCYVAFDWQSRGDGDVWHSQRSLPETEAEARKIVENNFSELGKSKSDRTPKMNETLKMTLKSTIVAPLAFVFIATMPVSYPIEQHIKRNTSTGAPFPVEAVNARAELRNAAAKPVIQPPAPDKARIEIRVADSAGKPIEDAEVLLIHSPIRFTAYADARLLRSYPIEKMDDDYGVSSELAGKLVHYLGIDGAPRGKVTGASGTLSIELRTGTKEYVQLPRMVHFLVNKPGYVPQVRTFQAEKLDTIDILTVILDHERHASNMIAKEFNPWIISHRLNQQVGYLSRKYSDETAWKVQPSTPPFDFERFKEYALAAHSFAPDYPIVQSAMFFLELENGNREEAKKYGRFIDNNIFTKAIYRMIWNDGTCYRY